MRILIRTSNWALWARRLGSLALPLAILPVFLHREGLIGSGDFTIIEIVAMSLAALALLLALGAFVRLWRTGDRGWGKATSGLIFSLLCLLPLAAILWLGAQYPPISDITTDFARPPSLVSETAPRPLSADERLVVTTAFPNAHTRTYPITASQMYGLLTQMAEARGWRLSYYRQPLPPLTDGQINAVATTLLGWRDEVAIRIHGDPQGSVIDMRSTALHPGHDLGENGRRIEEFLVALDESITLMLRDAPVAPAVPVEPADAG